MPKPSIKDPLNLELKPFPSNLKYIFLDPPSSLLVKIFLGLHENEEKKLLRVLKDNKETFV